MTESDKSIIAKFVKLGLSEQKAAETLKNKTVSKILLDLIEQVNDGCFEGNRGLIFYQLATKTKPQIYKFHELIIKCILSKKIDSVMKLDRALDFLLTNSTKKIEEDELDKVCGVGIIVTPEQVTECVKKWIKISESEILEKRYYFNVGTIMRNVRNELIWADGKDLKNEVDLQIFNMLGPKSDCDLKPKEKKSTKASSLEVKPIPEPLNIIDVMKKVNFHKPGENFKTEGYIITPHTENLLKKHLEITKGLVRTRFPPEPNGILHIGHAKAININFGYALANDGICLLRFDDTNPEKEEEKFFNNIIEMVSWLGYKPYTITYSSDYFNILYDYAVRLIEKNLAYVCHQKADELKGFQTLESPWRNRPIGESLQLFNDMKSGMFDEGEATLRMKIRLEEGKLDPVAYRIKYKPHHRTGSQWCIYPTYDFTHCLCDSIENITHSLCTKEFQSRRSSYYWLCNALNIYCPVQWEYGRLNINYSVVSKRKIAKLIEEKIVNDWDDPRLFTLTALKRRGIPPEAINNFCAQLGVTGANSIVDPAMLDAYVRDFLNIRAPRVMVVLDPLKITIRNYPFEKPQEIQMPNLMAKPELGTHPIMFNSTIFIESEDFQNKIIGEKDDFKRLALNQSVGLRHAGFVLTVVDVIRNSDTIVEVVCDCESVKINTITKPKAFIHWVAAEPLKIQVRLYKQLFKHKNPEDNNEVPDGFLSDCNPDSLEIKEAYADKSLQSCKIFDRFQFERIGYFSVDTDTTNDLIVFNQIVNLKEDSGK